MTGEACRGGRQSAGSRAVPGTGSFLHVKGAKSSGITLTANDLGLAATDVAMDKDVNASAVTRR